jgi:hypothetical protein
MFSPKNTLCGDWCQREAAEHIWVLEDGVIGGIESLRVIRNGFSIILY